jgi:hypothetical protein
VGTARDDFAGLVEESLPFVGESDRRSVGGHIYDNVCSGVDSRRLGVSDRVIDLNPSWSS